MMTTEDLRGLSHADIFQLSKRFSLEQVYDFEHHVMIGESLEVEGKLPSDFMLLQPQS